MNTEESRLLARLVGEERELAKRAVSQGWRISGTKSGVRLLSPDGVTTAGIHTSTSDRRAIKNLRAQLRRGGMT